MLRTAIRDLQWRRRRFAIGVAGTALVFGMTLVITGMSAGFDAEAAATVAHLRVDTWVAGPGASGPFLGSRPLPAVIVAVIGDLPGVKKAVPTVFTVKDVVSGSSVTSVAVFGAPPGTLGMPAVQQGMAPSRPGEIAVSTRLAGYPIGSRVDLGGHHFLVVGKVADASALGGTPDVFLGLRDAQAVAFAGQPVATSFAVRGSVPSQLPGGFVAMTHSAAQADLERALRSAKSSISLFAVILWAVAALIVGSVIYISALERQRDFAVFKATGVATRAIAAGVVVQAIVLALVAALFGCVFAAFLAPNIPMPVSITARAYILLPVLGAFIGALASLMGLRRAVLVDPALAFGGP